MKQAFVIEKTPPKPIESDVKKLQKLIANEDYQGKVKLNTARRPESFLQYT